LDRLSAPDSVCSHVGNLISVLFQNNTNFKVGPENNVAEPDYGANWQIRAQVQLMFPK